MYYLEGKVHVWYWNRIVFTLVSVIDFGIDHKSGITGEVAFKACWGGTYM